MSRYSSRSHARSLISLMQYNIGDRIHVSNVETDTSPTGSSGAQWRDTSVLHLSPSQLRLTFFFALGWIVKDVSLFHTTAVFASTGERATMSNGSLAGSRVRLL